MVKFKFILIILLALIIEISFISSLPIPFIAIKPDLLLIITCYATLLFGFSTGMLVGVFSGFLSDSFSGGAIGSMTASSAVCVLLIVIVRNHLYKEHLTTKFAVIWISSYVFAYVSTNITNIVQGGSRMPLINMEFLAFSFVNLAFSCILIPLLDMFLKGEVDRRA